MSNLLIIDGNSLAFRSHYAYAASPHGLCCNADEVPISMCLGFLQSLTRLIRQFQPKFLVTTFDPGGKTFRHELYPKYKANRQEKKKEPEYENMLIDLRNLQAVLRDLNIPVIICDRYEADDVIASIIEQVVLEDSFYIPNFIVASGDKDLLQLASLACDTSIFYSSGKNSKLYDFYLVEEEFGINPSLIPDFKAIAGDNSDNIPGVKGIGRKGAAKLINEYDSVAGILNNLDKLSPSMQAKFNACPEINLYKELATLNRSVKYQGKLTDWFLDIRPGRSLCVELELTKVVEQLQQACLLQKCDRFV